MKIVILDRDGTLNQESEDFVKTPEEWLPQPGVAEAVARLNHAGWHVVVATNQPGLGRGLFDVATLNAIHARMNKHLAAAGARVDAVFFCPHAPDEGCHCRKPLPGLFEQIAERFGVEPSDMVVAGNCTNHLAPAAALGAQPHLLRMGKSAHLNAADPLPTGYPPDTQVHASLGAFVDELLARPAPVAGLPAPAAR